MNGDGERRPRVPGAGGVPLGRVVIERSFPAVPERVWELWTTKLGLENWWGPDDVVLTVERLDPVPGGVVDFTFLYRPVADDPTRRAEFERAGVPVSYTARGRFTVVERLRRLAFSQTLDFGFPRPSHALHVEVGFRPRGNEVRMTLTVDGTATAHWKALAETSLRQQVERLVGAAASPPAPLTLK